MSDQLKKKRQTTQTMIQASDLQMRAGSGLNKEMHAYNGPMHFLDSSDPDKIEIESNVNNTTHEVYAYGKYTKLSNIYSLLTCFKRLFLLRAYLYFGTVKCSANGDCFR